MALKYNVQLNNGVEAFGTGKSITADADPDDTTGTTTPTTPASGDDPNAGND